MKLNEENLDEIIEKIKKEFNVSKTNKKYKLIKEDILPENNNENVFSFDIEEPKETKEKEVVSSFPQENKEENEIVKSFSQENQEDTIESKHFYIGYRERLLFNIVGIVIFALLAAILFVSNISIKTNNKVLYKQSSNLDYKVFLKANDYYKEPYLSKDMHYIASLIDNINIDLHYNFMASESINYSYTYYVEAKTLVSDSSDKSKVIYSKSENITKPKTTMMNHSTGFNINENLKIDYNKYNDLVKKFKSSYGISANSNLYLTLFVEIEDEKGNYINQSSSSEAVKLTIPLTEQMIDIDIDYKEVNESNDTKVYKDFNILSKTKTILSIISLIISLGFTVRLLLFLKKTTVKKSKYAITLSKILREYDRVIVNSKKVVDVGENIVDVNTFEELLDARDNLEKPIIFSEIHKGQKGVFIVKTENESYRYVLKQADLEK